MEDAGTSVEDGDIDSQDSNTPIDHSHLARNCSIKIITPAVKASVISYKMASRSMVRRIVLLLCRALAKDLRDYIVTKDGKVVYGLDRGF